MNYSVSIARSAEKEFSALPRHVQDRVREKILSLESNPRPVGVKKLRDTECYRIRAGDYRALYSIDDARHQILVLSIAHRKDVYR